jgi:hypothetical protein
MFADTPLPQSTAYKQVEEAVSGAKLRSGVDMVVLSRTKHERYGMLSMEHQSRSHGTQDGSEVTPLGYRK